VSRVGRWHLNDSPGTRNGNLLFFEAGSTSGMMFKAAGRRSRGYLPRPTRKGPRIFTHGTQVPFWLSLILPDAANPKSTGRSTVKGRSKSGRTRWLNSPGHIVAAVRNSATAANSCDASCSRS
jgi:hypothetical protein